MYHVRTKKISTVQTFPTPNQVEYWINCGKQSPFSQASTTIDWPLRLWPLSAEIASWNFAPNDRQRKRSGPRSAELPWCPVKNINFSPVELRPLASDASSALAYLSTSSLHITGRFSTLSALVCWKSRHTTAAVPFPLPRKISTHLLLTTSVEESKGAEHHCRAVGSVLPHRIHQSLQLLPLDTLRQIQHLCSFHEIHLITS